MLKWLPMPHRTPHPFPYHHLSAPWPQYPSIICNPAMHRNENLRKVTIKNLVCLYRSRSQDLISILHFHLQHFELCLLHLDWLLLSINWNYRYCLPNLLLMSFVDRCCTHVESSSPLLCSRVCPRIRSRIRAPQEAVVLLWLILLRYSKILLVQTLFLYWTQRLVILILYLVAWRLDRCLMGCPHWLAITSRFANA